MGTRGLRVYRARRIYYSTYLPYDAYPTGAGKEIVEEIPIDPAALKVWIAGNINHFEKERDIVKLREDDHSNGHPGKQEWGVYAKRPTPEEPHGTPHIELVYIVDRDNSYLAARGGSGWSRYFKLENLQYHLFEEDLSEEEMLAMPVSLESLYTTTPGSIGYDATQLARFAKHAHHLSRVDDPQENKPGTTSVYLNSWKPLTHRLLGKFLDRYLTFFRDLASPGNIAIFPDRDV